MLTGEESDTDFAKITELLGSRRQQFHPDTLLMDNEFPLERPEPRPENKYEEWDRPDLREFTDPIGAAWEEELADRYDMELVRNGPVDLQVTDGPLEGSPVQAKNACVINSKGQRNDGSWRSRPGLIYIKKPEMKKLAGLDFDEVTGLDSEDYTPPALLHAAVHYPRENMPELPTEVPIREIQFPGERDYGFKTAYIGEIIVPISPLYQDHNDKFNSGDRQAWPLEWRNAFGDGEENYMEYWKDERLESAL